MVTVIGDVHGKYGGYYVKTEKVECSVQLGDMGFDYSFLQKNIDPERHKFFGGNHDNYTVLRPTVGAWLPHDIGDFGQTSFNGVDFFHIRGGYSIDLHYRKLNESWWAEEELPEVIWPHVERVWNQTKPDIVISHECPTVCSPYVSTNSERSLMAHFKCVLPSRTAIWLQRLFESHQPRLWIHGHFHRSRKYTINGTKFISLGELEAYTIA